MFAPSAVSNEAGFVAMKADGKQGHKGWETETQHWLLVATKWYLQTSTTSRHLSSCLLDLQSLCSYQGYSQVPVLCVRVRNACGAL